MIKPSFPQDFIHRLKKPIENELFESVVPFWLRHGRDTECGGYAWLLNRDGSVFDWNKLGMWSNGRICWTFAFLYNECKQDPQWLEMARRGVEFALQHGFNSDGWMYYALTREGEPLESPRDVFNETSHAIGFSEYGRATGDPEMADRGWKLFCRVWQRMQQPNQAFQPLSESAEPVRLLAHAFIALNTLHELRRFDERPEMPAMVDQCLDWILNYHVDRDTGTLMEIVTWEGKRAPSYWGRWVRPGHIIETGLFVVHEAEHRSDPALLQRGIELIRQGFKHGWDPEFGGLYNDVDLEGKPIALHSVYVASTKTWWQHAEALYGLLLAYAYTGQAEDREAFDAVYNYTFTHFPDTEYGEWYGLLDRRGHRITDAKALAHKNSFHTVRNLFSCLELFKRASCSTETTGTAK